MATHATRDPGDVSWERLLEAPTPGQHLVQLYANAAFLARAIGRYIGEGIRAGEGALLVSTAAHARLVLGRLRDDGFEPHDLEARGQLVVLDAQRTLAGLLVDRVLHRARFRSVIGTVVKAIKTRGHARIRAFGEMVDLLRRRSLAEALRLEKLWNEVLAEDGIVLLCAYAIDPFDPRSYDGTLQRVSAAHTHLVPAEDYARLDAAVARAYGEVFGSQGGDAAFLRRAFVRHYPRPASMPDAQAAILAAHEFVPAAAGLILERAGRHYAESVRAGPPSGAGPSGEAAEGTEI